ncbi:uncharacterized protein EV420DRAFT_106506 [Desarmillaria tabescens]|uniref:Uncharacterized protein n=1 Tax=Armillaria tabescens TaxID=1929756 RepID=A0AA39U993_ARMTA|nr:uncharacterized protein EV420DRAFT_106506 [Desarmillaria tabescens]KAK0470325.1 hypothetical protein EV420DRAFT_106506 [Desarmillaria tabescens]
MLRAYTFLTAGVFMPGGRASPFGTLHTVLATLRRTPVPRTAYVQFFGLRLTLVIRYEQMTAEIKTTYPIQTYLSSFPDGRDCPFIHLYRTPRCQLNMEWYPRMKAWIQSYSGQGSTSSIAGSCPITQKVFAGKRPRIFRFSQRRSSSSQSLIGFRRPVCGPKERTQAFCEATRCVRT